MLCSIIAQLNATIRPAKRKKPRRFLTIITNCCGEHSIASRVPPIIMATTCPLDFFRFKMYSILWALAEQ
ncbi:hypothetical protein DERF_008128 [Dermatophagoides farinae]|uniref:Uncharacterized protein n=1 Tax=Dermatophagoides farinae TaxID=6954 RepID=A0A922L6P1_DERFA|nr:hypothetical protein DERF_008128 [Dermatophagoides farinae]